MKKYLFLAVGLFFFTQSAFSQNWGKAPYIGGDGVTELGRHIDFHEISNGLEDYTLRLTAMSGSLYSSGNFSMPGLGINTGILGNSKMHIFGNSSNTTNLIMSANFENSYRWKFKTIDRGQAIDFDIVGTNSGDQEETLLKLSPSFSGRPELSFMNDWLIVNNGNVGIGTTNPQSALQIGDFNDNSVEKHITIPGSYNFETVKLGQIGNGNAALEMVNHNGSNSSYGVRILAGIDFGGAGLQLQYAAPKTNYSELDYLTGIMLNVAGNVGIGTTSPKEKLSVNGKIRAHEVKVETANWPDYVFDQDYKILGLPELDAYIKRHKHLPEMPPAKAVEKNGIDLGEMNKLLLKKIEELTLQLIEVNKVVQRHQDQIKDLNTKLHE